MYIDICKKIGSLMIQNKLTNQGLIYGKTGVSIFLYTLAKKLSDEQYAQYADGLLDSIYENKISSPNFMDGIAGIGWGIEYLIQSGFCEGNTDEILEDIDTRIFKILNESNNIPLNLQGLIGYLQYITMRLKNREHYQDPDSLAINKELFKHIVNKIDQKAPELFNTITQDIKLNLLEDIYILLLSIDIAFEVKIYNTKILKMFNQWEMYWVSHFPTMHFNRLYLAAILSQINQKLNSKKTEKHIKTLLYSIDREQLKQEVDINTKTISSISNGFLGLILILNKCIDSFNSTYPNYDLLSVLRYEILNLCNIKLIEKLEDDLISNKCDSNFEFGLAFGWAGVGLFLLLNHETLDGTI